MTRARSLSQLANSNVFTVATNNRVGIGSDTPTTKLDVDGALNVSGNAAFGGVVTYEDVTNVDSVGIVTARSGVSVPDGQKIQLGTGNDLQIYHTGSHSLIDEAGTGNLTIRSSLISFEKYTNEQLARFTADGSCELFHDNSKKFETTSSGVSITGDATFAGTDIALDDTGIYLMDGGSAGSGNYRSRVLTDGTAQFASGAFVVSSTGNLSIDRTSGTNDILNGKLNGTVTSTINADGSATFKGKVDIDGSYLNVQRTSSSQTILQGGYTGNASNALILADGDATFAGVLQVNGTSSSHLYANGDGIFQRDTSGADVIALNNDGSSEFAGTMIVGSDPDVTSNSGCKLFASGTIRARSTSSTSSGILFEGFGAGQSSSQFKVTADGAAEFVARVQAGASDYTGSHAMQATNDRSDRATILATQYDTTGPVFEGRDGSVSTTTATSKINADGSALFASSKAWMTSTASLHLGTGDVTTSSNRTITLRGDLGTGDFTGEIISASGGTPSSNGSIPGVRINTTDSGNVLSYGGVFRIYSNGGSGSYNTITSEISNDGSAEFAGNGKWFDFDTTDATNGYGALISTSSSGSTLRTVLQLQAKGGASASGAALGIRRGTTQNILLEYGGNATFAGNIQSGGSPLDGDGVEQGALVRSIGSIIAAGASSNSGVWAGKLAGQTGDTSSIKADGSATFSGAITVGDGINTSSTTNSGSVYYSGGSIYTQTAASATATNDRFRLYYGTSLNVSIQNNGNATFAGTVTENSSDRKFKENIADAPSQLADVAALQLRTWDWNDLAPGSEERNARHRMGLVAQEAELVDPNLSYEVSDGEDSYKAIDYKVLTMKLLGAVAELKAEVEALKNA